jgi:ComF family protein
MLARLLTLIFPLRSGEEIVRALEEDTFLALLSPELVERTTPPTIALFPFRNQTVRAVIHEAKYHGMHKACALLGSALTEYLRDSDRLDGLRDCVLVPIPLGKARRKKRGFNQAEEVARRASKELGIPLETTLLTKTRETASQVSLPRIERLENMRGAFSFARKASPELTYILVDDVTTTGATLLAAIVALKEAGATSILPIALAH